MQEKEGPIANGGRQEEIFYPRVGLEGEQLGEPGGVRGGQLY